MAYCIHCKKQFATKDKFCILCGQELVAEDKVCIHCGRQLSADDKFCIYCGQPVGGAAEQRSNSGYEIKADQMAHDGRTQVVRQMDSQSQRPPRQAQGTAQYRQGQAPRPMQPQRPVQSQRTMQPQRPMPAPEPPKKKKTGLIIGMIAVILVLAIGIGVGAAFLMNDDAEEEADVVYVPMPAGDAGEPEEESVKETETSAAQTEKAEIKKETKKESDAANSVTVEKKKPAEQKDDSPYPGQKFPYSSQQYLSASDLRGMTRDEIQLSINDIYARNGYIFKDDGLRAYYQSQSWYHGTNGDMNAVYWSMNDIERANVELMSNYH